MLFSYVYEADQFFIKQKKVGYARRTAEETPKEIPSLLIFIHDFLYGIRIKSHKCYEIEITYCTNMIGEQKWKMKDTRAFEYLEEGKIKWFENKIGLGRWKFEPGRKSSWNDLWKVYNEL